MLSDDIWRYIHDGRTLAAGASPYQHAPAELAVQDRITRQVNHPELVTIYQPTSQWIFAAITMVSTNDKMFRLGLCLFDLAIVGLILVGLVRTGLSPWWAVLYAWHPLVLSEVAGSGHQDVIGIAMLLACLLLADRDEPSAVRWMLAGAAFAMAVAVKPIVFPLALVLAWHGRKELRLVAIAITSAAVMGIALYLPFLMMPRGLSRLWETSQTFVENWAFNSSLHGIIWSLTGSAQLARWAAAGVLLSILLICMWRKVGLWPTCMAYLFGSLLCSSTVYPWYLLWALALLPWCPSIGLWMFSLTVVLGYEVLGHPQVWRVPLWVSVAVYVPVVVGLIIDFRNRERDSPKWDANLISKN